MKKLMIAAAIAFAATFANAAAVGWSCAGLNSYAGDAYQFFVIGQNGVTSIAQITALVEKGTSVGTYEFGSGVIADNGAIMMATTDSGKVLSAGATYDAFFVLFNDDTIADATKYIAITPTQGANLHKEVSGTAGTISFAAGAQGSYVNDPTNWTSVSVPEPTSGLMLLIGMGALALRRRRA